VLDIILQHWFLIDSSFQLSKSEDKDEDEDTSSTKLNPDSKRKGLKLSHQGDLIDPSSHVGIWPSDPTTIFWFYIGKTYNVNNGKFECEMLVTTTANAITQKMNT
jgi:hypothetical protein